jgi:hypothetical protein
VCRCWCNYAYITLAVSITTETMQNMRKGVYRRFASHECLRNNTNITAVDTIQLLVNEKRTYNRLYIISSFTAHAQGISNTATISGGIIQTYRVTEFCHLTNFHLILRTEDLQCKDITSASYWQHIWFESLVGNRYSKWRFRSYVNFSWHNISK